MWSINLSLPLRSSSATKAATVVAVILHSPVLHLSCTASPRGAIHTDLLWQLKCSNLQNRNPTLYHPRIPKYPFLRYGAGWRGRPVVSDGAGANKAKSQQIHLLSAVISLCNLRQFVSFRCQQIWKHYVKKPSGKIIMCVVTEIYKTA